MLVTCMTAPLNQSRGDVSSEGSRGEAQRTANKMEEQSILVAV